MSKSKISEGVIGKLIWVVAILLMLPLFSGCGATAAYEGAKTANDATFEAALVRICSPVATMAAMRRLDADGMAARQLLCESLVVSPNN